MTAQELDTMVKAMRTKYNNVPSRVDLEDSIYYLTQGLRAIGKKDLADELWKIHGEIENIDTDEIVELGMFRD